MARFYALFSSSKGNAHYIGTPSGGLLIDAGVSYARLQQALHRYELHPNAIQGILITHTHVDHIKGLRPLLRQTDAKLYATADTIKSLIRSSIITMERVGMVLPENEPISIGDYQVTAFLTPHDAAGSCGFRIDTPDGRSCSLCTDLGSMTETILQVICGSNLVLLEANYDKRMLENGYYPPYLKERIAGKYGHLSNTDSAAVARKLIETGTTRIILGHLSLDNNKPNLAEQTLVYALSNKFKRNQDYILEVAAPDGCREMVVF